jgi:hypothetical protein
MLKKSVATIRRGQGHSEQGQSREMLKKSEATIRRGQGHSEQGQCKEILKKSEAQYAEIKVIVNKVRAKRC